MLAEINSRYSGGCVMVLKSNEQGGIDFLGTGFFIDPYGYVLTAAHVVNPTEKLFITATYPNTDFSKMTLGQVQATSVSLQQYDPINDLALLKPVVQPGLSMPERIFGNSDELLTGSSICYLGYPFGHSSLHILSCMSGVVSSKVVSSQGVKMIQIDNMCHEGNSGGPLISVRTGLIVGVVSGRFNPIPGGGGVFVGNRPLGVDTNISYAVAIEYAFGLLESEGIHVRK